MVNELNLINLETRKDKILAGISSFLVFGFSYIIFIYTPGAYYFPVEYLAILSVAVATMTYMIQINPKNKLVIGERERFIRYMTFEGGTKISGEVLWKDVKSFTVVSQEDHREYFVENPISEEELWRTETICRFNKNGVDIEIIVKGDAPNYSENIMKLVHWNFLTSSDGDSFYHLNSSKF